VCGPDEPSLGCHYYAEESRDTCICAGQLAECEATDVYTCAGGNALGTCTDGFLVPSDCDDICFEAGYGGGDACGASPDSAGDTCFCGNTCLEGAARCDGNGTVAFCSAGYWNSYSCQQLCEESGWQVSLGCRYDTGWGDSSCGCL
jgi:hypothetical protein